MARRISVLVVIVAAMATVTPLASAASITWGAPVLVDGSPPFATTASPSALACPPGGRFCIAIEDRIEGGKILKLARSGSATPVLRSTDYAALPPFAVWALPFGSVPLACPSVRLCVGSTGAALFTSTDPGGGAWRLQSTARGVTSLSCPTARLCVGVSGSDVVLSTTPSGGSGWRRYRVGLPTREEGVGNAVACASARLCVAVAISDLPTGAAYVFVSTHPAGGARTWKRTRLPGPANFAAADVSCPSIRLCVITDAAGHVVTSTRPTGGRRAWKVGRVAAVNRLLSCPDSRLCVSGWGLPWQANPRLVAVSIDPARGARSWRTVSLPGSPAIFSALTCPSERFCAAVDSADDYTTSADPGGGSQAWRTVNLGEGYNAIASVACPTRALCVASDNEGNILTSTSPGAANPTWSASKVNPGPFPPGMPPPGAVSCPSSSFCAVAAGTQVFLSADPTAGASAWSARKLPVQRITPLQSLSCPSAQLCVASDGTGQVLTATDPGNGSWEPAMLGGLLGVYHGEHFYDAITAVSCPSTSFCAATDGSNLRTSSDPTAGAAAWHKSPLPARGGGGLVCPTATLCIAASGTTLTVTSDPGDPTPTWVPIGVTGLPPSVRLVGLACATIHACVAVDAYDGYAISGDPTAAGATWTAAQIAAPTASFPGPGPPFRYLTAVGCEPTGLCVATDGTGHAIAGQWSG